MEHPDCGRIVFFVGVYNQRFIPAKKDRLNLRLNRFFPGRPGLRAIHHFATNSPGEKGRLLFDVHDI